MHVDRDATLSRISTWRRLYANTILYIGTIRFAGMMNSISALGNTMGSCVFNSVLVLAG
jgi:hypothetical protein